MDIFLFFLYVISLIVMADTKLKEFPSGQRFLNGLEDGTVNLLRWRAEADADLDMIGIKKFLLISTLILFVTAFIMMSNDIKPNIYFASTLLVNFLLFSSVQWFLDVKKETFKMIGFMLLTVATPWIMHFFGEISGISPSFIDIFRDQFQPLGFTQDSDYLFLSELSLILLLGCAMMLGSWLIMLAIPSVTLLWLIKIINRVSFLLVGIERQKVQLFFIGVNILVPIWFFAKDRIA
ncbi:hypothetical protein [Thalassolituus sp. C2-1]|uniref:hypothetical protein n=1 Tax=Venatorbacter sp. C2-1 TaxID=2597518 RepID=UPI001197E560|nr:hypothetical protein [Thalassolituus sp. C2-1]TVV44873.1 hypothetical protein FOT50_06870 [Thalassolituus sp. C2-1]